MGIFYFSHMYRIIINKPKQDNQKAIVTIGNFDGMHSGHKQLFLTLDMKAKLHNYRRIVITFEPLPHEYFCDVKREQRLTRLCLLRDKFLILQEWSLIDELVVLHFNASVANLSPEMFIRTILQLSLNVQEAVVGHDFRFGKNGAGTVADFTRLGIVCTEVPPFCENSERISSSLIRSHARENNLAMVKSYLGRNIRYTSRVIHGNKTGRKFGVPTINLSLGRNRPALWGVYVALVHIEQATYPAIAGIGKNPTTNELDVYKLEAHLLDVDLDLYGKIATVEILHFVRDERKFDDLDSLFAQIHQDIQDARDYFE